MGTPLLFLRINMRVLFTGMASAHCAKPSNVTFFSTLSDVISEFAEVVWAAPKLSWTKEDLDKFDVVIFGLTPPTAMSANKIYGAMHVLGLMYHSPKLRLVLDSQQVWQYKNSLEAVKKDVNVLFNSFFSSKTGYAQAKTDSRKYIELAASYMSSSYWPVTYYPRLPWNTDAKTASLLGFVPTDKLKGINLDSMLLLPEPYSTGSRSNLWSVEDTKRSWYKNLSPTLRYADVDVKLSRALDDSGASVLIRSSMGLIIPPQDRKIGTWWSYKHVQAMNSNTPVATLWQDSIKLDASWAYLPYQLEDISEPERRIIARDQIESYYAAIPSKNRLIEDIRNDLINLTKERTQ